MRFAGTLLAVSSHTLLTESCTKSSGCQIFKDSNTENWISYFIFAHLKKCLPGFIYSVPMCMFTFWLVCLCVQVTPSSRCTFSLLTSLPRGLVDVMTLRCVCVTENMLHITIPHFCTTFFMTPQSPALWTVTLSHDTLKSLSRLPKQWRSIRVHSRTNRHPIHTLAQIHTASKVRWRGRRFCGDPGFNPAVGPFPSATAKKTWRILSMSIFLRKHMIKSFTPCYMVWGGAGDASCEVKLHKWRYEGIKNELRYYWTSCGLYNVAAVHIPSLNQGSILLI